MALATFSTRSKKDANGREKWYVRLNLEGKRTDRFGGYSEKEANHKGHQLVIEYEKDPEGFFTNSKLTQVGVRGVLEEFLSRPVSDDTNNYNRSHMEPILAGYLIASLTDIDKYLPKRIKKDMKAAGLSDAYVSMRLRVLRAFINFCLYKGYLKQDPWPSKKNGEQVSVIPKYKGSGYYYSDEEYRKLTETPPVTESQRDIVRAIRIVWHQGWREKHVWRFEWERADLDRNVYNLHGMKQAPDKEVPLHPQTIRVMEEMGTGERSKRLFKRWENSATIGQLFRKWRTHCGVVRGDFHDLKHSCVSRLLEAGWTLAQVSEYTNTSIAALAWYQHAHKKTLADKVAVFNPAPIVLKEAKSA